MLADADSLGATFEYLAQDFSWNNANGAFVLNLHSEVIPAAMIDTINASIRYEPFSNGVLAIFQQLELSAVVHCRCKLGDPVGDPTVRFEGGTRLAVHWPGVARIFVRVRIMDLATPANLMDSLQDCILSGHSVSDVEDPDQNQSFRPWSEDEDSDTGSS
jgi:hypothetical protein